MTTYLRIAESQPVATLGILELLKRMIERSQVRIPAWQRSIEEIKLDWNIK